MGEQEGQAAARNSLSHHTVGFDNNVLLMLAVYAMKLNAPFS